MWQSWGLLRFSCYNFSRGLSTYVRQSQTVLNLNVWTEGKGGGYHITDHIQVQISLRLRPTKMTRGRRGVAGGAGGQKRGGNKSKGAGGLGSISIGDELKIAVNLSLKKFIESSDDTELSLPSSLFSTERAYVHKVAAEMGLQSKSRGKGQTRYKSYS